MSSSSSSSSSKITEIKKGFLSKLPKESAKLQTFKKRWFILTSEPSLTYYENSDAKKPVNDHAKIMLEYSNEITHEANSLVFELRTSTRKYTFKAETKDDALQWVTVIKQAIVPQTGLSLATKMAKIVKNNKDEDEALTKKKGVQDYDIVCDIGSIKSLGTEGWMITSLESDALMRDKDQAHVVSVIGLFNRGKTFILSKIAGMQLEEGDIVHTRGLSIKYPDTFAGQNLLILDTAGKSAPVPGSTSDEANIIDRKATEAFLQECICHFSDTVLVVLNRLTFPDQIFLLGFIKQIGALRSQKRSNSCDIIVVHNFRDISTEAALSKVVDEELKGCFDAAPKSYPLVHDGEKIQAEYYASGSATVKLRHVVLVKQGSAIDARNVIGFKLLHTWIQSASTTVTRRLNIVSDLTAFAQLRLKNYLANPLALSQVRVDDCNTKIVADLEPVFRNLQFSDSGVIFDFNSDEFEIRYDLLEDNDHFYLIFDLPGHEFKSFKTLEIKLTSQAVSVQGKRELVVPENLRLLSQGRSYGQFKKTVTLPTPIDEKNAGTSKSLENGILTIKLVKETRSEITL